MDYALRLPDGTELSGENPVVIVGPNGSGKSRKARELRASVSIEFVNALRNTRVSPDIPAMGYEAAQNHFAQQRSQAKVSHWELVSDFDMLLSQLLGQKAMQAMEYMDNIRLARGTQSLPLPIPLTQVEDVWRDVFPGRELLWRDWKPLVRSNTSGSSVEYSGNQMSDGEKAALYLAGWVFSTKPGIIVVDEPETHLHSLLAIRLWNALEAARPDIRFVYITHDLSFALSRKSPLFILASPIDGLRVLNLGDDLPSDLAEVLLGSASLSFYASRVVFCEGNPTSIDVRLYTAWFSAQGTIVRSVGSCQLVMRCVEALRASNIANSLTAEGIVDRDFHPSAFLDNLPAGVNALKVHEVESLFCLPDVVAAVAQHLSRGFSRGDYLKRLSDSVTAPERHKVIIERWKRRLEPNLVGLVASIKAKPKPIEDIINELPTMFDHTAWSFSPEKMLEEESTKVEALSPTGSIDEFLKLLPGKRFLNLAVKTVGMQDDAYIDLVINAVQGKDKNLAALSATLRNALLNYLPLSCV